MSRRVENDRKSERPAVCPECIAGIMQLDHITYFTWLDEELIIVQNFPAWVCDICGRREFDAQAINRLNTLLNPAAGKAQVHSLRRRGSTSSSEQPHP
jgi:YgiT-type zinc finger domain-containing protein